MRRPIYFFLLAGIAGMLAALTVYSALKQREAALVRANAQTVNVVVAARALPLGAKLESGSVKLVRWSRDALPPGSYQDATPVIGAVVSNAFLENEPIVATKLFMGQKTAGVMPLLIPPGMRAMSVPVDKVSDVAGFVQPQTHVDVVVAMANSTGRDEKPFSKTVLENVEVLAVNQQIETDKDKAHVVEVVTLLVNPDEAERLALASSEGGVLRLSIRNYDDAKVVLTHGSDIQDLTRAYASAPPPLLRAQGVAHLASPRPGPPPVSIHVYRDGQSEETVSFIHAANDQPVTPQKSKPREVASRSANHTKSPTKAGRKVAAKATAARTKTASLKVAAAHARKVVAPPTPIISASAASSGSNANPKVIDIP